MLLTKKIKMGLIGFTVLLAGAVALPAYAENRVPDVHVQRRVADRLDNFKSTVFALHRRADLLKSHSNRGLSWRTHADHLTMIKGHVNELGRSLFELEELKAQASDSQKLAIEHARPHLAAVAQSTAQAIELLNENQGIIRFPEYVDVASGIYDHADTLRMKVDAILDFDSAKARLDTLELQPMSSEGS